MAYYFNNLFPPVVPPNMPAYDGTESLRFYFQLSVANSRDQFKHAQVIVNKLQTNQNALNTTTYPVGIVFIENSDILYDATIGMYYFDLPANLLALDNYYKLQIRLGAQDLNTVPATNYIWLNNPDEYNQFSEWSTVCILKPITVPEYDLVGFSSKNTNGSYVEPVYITDNVVNVANTPGFLFIGKYAAKDANKEEIISSYEFTLYADNGITVESSWTKLSESGTLTIGQYGSSTIQHSFDYTLEKGKKYYVKFTVKSKNGFTDSKIYKVLVMFAEVNLFNTFHITPNEEKAKISLQVQGKQLLLKAIGTTTVVEPVKDATVPPEILQTHMIVKGKVQESENLHFYGIDGKWVVQMRALGIKPLASKALALKNPVFILEETPTNASAVYNIIKLCAVKSKISYDREATARWINDFILVKEVWSKKKGFLFKQEKYVSFTNGGVVANSADFIAPLNEYYFWIKEDNGLMEFTAQKLRTSTNTEVTTYANTYVFNN